MPTRPLGVALRRHSLVFVIAAGIAVGALPRDAIFGAQPRRTPVHLARNVDALAVDAPEPLRKRFYVSNLAGGVPAALNPRPVRVMLIDGNRDWRFVPFTHDEHAAVLGGAESCRLCHHQNMTFDQNTACYQCHRDMYELTDTFEHNLHIQKLEGNRSCQVCHHDPAGKKSRAASLACWQCHGDMVVSGSRILPGHELKGFATGYLDAMHGLCVGCHEELSKQKPETYGDHFGRCDVCHREFEDRDYRRMAPYVPMPPGHSDQQLWEPPKAPTSSSADEARSGSGGE